MKTWEYMEPGDLSFDEVIHVRKTEAEIIAEYCPHWTERMRALGREHLISDQNCIEDWAVVNWAYEV